MLKKLLPRNDLFFDFFKQHADLIVQAAQTLQDFFPSTNNPHETFEKIKSIEKEGDKITHQCVEALHKTFITPIERSDIYRLMTTLDDILDEIEDIGRLIIIYKLTQLPAEALQLAHLTVQATMEIGTAIQELRKMKITKEIQKNFFAINQLENEADTILVHAISRLFDEEKDVKMIIKWKEVYEHFEHATDLCEDAANILEGILLENE